MEATTKMGKLLKKFILYFIFLVGKILGYVVKEASEAEKETKSPNGVRFQLKSLSFPQVNGTIHLQKKKGIYGIACNATYT